MRERRTGWFDKRCANPDCGYADEPLREFYVRPTGGPHARCLVCFKEQAVENYWRKREERLAKAAAARLANIEEFRARDRARYPARRERQSEYLKRWKRRNRDKVSAYELKRQAQKKGAPDAEIIIREEIYARDGGRCHICGKKVPLAEFTLDHLNPLSKGGSHTRLNVATAHRSCNSSRHAGRLPAQLLLA